MNNDTDLSKTLSENNEDIMSEFDLQYSINELDGILESSQSIEHKIRYSAESVPVFYMKNEEGVLEFVVEQENLMKLMKSQHISATTALKQIKEFTCEEMKDKIISNDETELNLAVVFNREDMGNFERIFKESTSAGKLDTRISMVEEHSNLLEEIKATGTRLYHKRNGR